MVEIFIYIYIYPGDYFHPLCRQVLHPLHPHLRDFFGQIQDDLPLIEAQKSRIKERPEPILLIERIEFRCHRQQ
jgi:hypothetical protein